MRFAPALDEVDLVKSNVLSCFVACDVDGMCKAYAVVDASRYDMGTARPIEVGSWWVEFLSRDEVVFQGAKTPGDILFIRRTDYVLIAVAGGEVEGPSSKYVKILKQERIRRKEEQVAREREQAEAEKRQRFAERITEDIVSRGQRLEKDQKTLVMFPELNNFRPALGHELQTQQKLLVQLNAAQDINILASEVKEANKSELTELGPLRDQALNIVQQQLRVEKGKREAIVQAEREREAAAQAKREVAERERREEAENQAKREKEAQLAQSSSGCGCVILVVALGLSTVLMSKFSVVLFQLVALFLHKAF